jgi:MSHA biogenesis protein MshO
MVAVIAITGVLASTVAVFMRVPLQAYQDAQRRASISDAADTVFVMLKRDLQTALPNSVRVTSVGSVFYLEFLQVRTGGRYRAEDSAAAVATSASTCPDTGTPAQPSANGIADENVLEFGTPDTCFTTIGAVQNLSAIAPGADFVVVYNLGSGFSGADAYASANANKSRVTAVSAGTGGENVFTFQSNTFPLESPGRRFHIVSGPVTYVCDPAAGTLRRISGYAIADAQPTPPAGADALLAKGITGCTVTYDQNVINQQAGIVSMWLRFEDPAGGTTANLFQQVQVSNEP